MTRRRLEMMGDRIEAVLASHKITGHCHGGYVNTHSVVFAVTFAPGNSLRQLMACKDEIELALGHAVLIHHEPYVRVRVLGWR